MSQVDPIQPSPASATAAPVASLPPAPAPANPALKVLRILWHDRAPNFWTRFPNVWTLAVLLPLLTVLGGFLRFWRIAHQGYWYDEGRTITRIGGTFDEMMRSLGDQGFPPGWYVLLHWWANKMIVWTGSAATAFSPESLRAVPAFFGTLMVVGMYFLARQFTDRKGALLVMLLAAVNPYLIYYSRDLKMYMALWCFLTWHVAFFFRWQTSRRTWLEWGLLPRVPRWIHVPFAAVCHHGIWWPLFVLTGAAMVSVHASAWFVVAVELVWVLTKPKLKSLDGPLWIIGVGIISYVPIWWYLTKNSWVGQTGAGGSSGLEWLNDYTSMEWRTVAGLPVVHLFGYLWPQALPDYRLEYWFGLGPTFRQHLDTRSLPWLMRWEFYGIIALFGIMLVGLFPWRGPRTSVECRQRPTYGRWWWVALWIAVPMVTLILVAMPEDNYWRLPGDWRWVQLWHLAILVPILAVPWVFVRWKMPASLTRNVVLWLLVMPAVAYGVLWFLAAHHDYSLKPHTLLWEPRYLGIIIPAWILWLAASLRRLPTLPLRTVAILFVLSASVASALVNHLAYRQAPWNRVAEAWKPYYHKERPTSLAVGTPYTRFPGEADMFTFQIAAGMHPETRNRYLSEGVPLPLYPLGRAKPDSYTAARRPRYGSLAAWAIRTAQEPGVQTIVMADREADLTTGPLTNDALADGMGPEWKLVRDEKYGWYYEWHYYFFHTWRTRVWVRQPAPKGP